MDDENFIVEGIRLAKSIIKELQGLDAQIKKWSTLQKSEVDEYIKKPDMKNITPENKAIDVKYRVTESENPPRDQKRQKNPSK